MIETNGQETVIKYMIRDAKSSDIDDIYTLSSLLNTVNLPANKAELEQVIEESEKSFSLTERNSTKRAFLFVLVNSEDHVIGTSQIFAKHGTLTSPHHFFQVGHDERYSETLKKYFRHRTLRLCRSFDGPTEIGSLVLDTKYRSSKEKLGKMLSYVRFLFIAMKPEYFSNTILAELLPPLGSQFESALWDAVGRKFTGLDYYEADMISRKNKEFIKTLFPSGEIHTSLLPETAQEVIGQVGRNSKGAAHLLAKIGFRYAHRVDPFDGGPHFEAEQQEISLIKQAQFGRAKVAQTMADSNVAETRYQMFGRFLPKRESGDRFRAVVAAVHSSTKEHIVLDRGVVNLLTIAENDDVSAIEFDRNE